MNRVFVIADTHFGHKKVVEFRPFSTVEEHDRGLIQRWNAVVRKDDSVWHLGDVYLGGKDNHTILGQLNGVKRLVMGNHDCYPLEIYQRYFNKIYGATEYKGYIMTHIPVSENQFSRFKGNIHGHMHSNKLEDKRYICVSCEQINYTPVPILELLQ